MATKVLDFDRVQDLLRKYRPQVEVCSIGGGNKGLKFLCPFHNDSNPSFIFSTIKGTGHCFACKEQASLERVIAALEQISLNEAEKQVAGCFKVVKHDVAVRKPSVTDVSLSQLNDWHSKLGTDLRLNTLIARWGWNAEVQSKYMLGVTENKLVIPMFEGETLVGIKYYSPGSSSVKYQNHPGSTPCCWPLENLREDIVFLVEGEKDCLTMLSAGFNAVTFTTGAGSVPKDYIRFFAGKDVYIIYDIDEAGRKGAVTVANTLACATKKLHIVDLPLDGIPKGDLTDAYMEDPEGFVAYIDNLVKNTDIYEAPATVNRVTISSEVHKTYLEEIVNNKLFYKRVRVKARVISSVHNETSIIPKDVLFSCNRDFKDKVCQSCPAFFATSGIELHVKPEYTEIMCMVGGDVRAVRKAIQGMLGIDEACNKYKIEQKTHQALYPVVVIPAIEADKKKHNYSLVEAWALDVPAKENEDYDVEAVVMTDPDTHHMVLLCYIMQQDAASIDSFELTEDMIERLRCFQCNSHPSNKSETS